MGSGLLETPRGQTPALGLFCAHFGLDADRLRPGSRGALEAVAAAFSKIPYENLTKIIARGTSKRQPRKRSPAVVIEQYAAHGSGGTCFSLTALMLHLLRALGWRAEPLLADRHYGANTHSALLVWFDGAPHLLDPGYLIVRPMALDRSAETRLATPFNEVILTPRQGGERIDLETLEDGNRSLRLTFKSRPADAGEFLRAWDASFGWDMMRYPVLTTVAGGRHVYLEGGRLRVRGRGGVERTDIPLDELPGRVAREFGVDASLVGRALDILRRQGESCGAAGRP